MATKKSTKQRVITVDRSKLMQCGLSDGKCMCITGHLLNQAGLPIKALKGKVRLKEVVSKMKLNCLCSLDLSLISLLCELEDGELTDTELGYELIEANDSDKITNEVREAKINKLLAPHKIVIKFIGKYNKDFVACDEPLD